jgi:NADH-quinone oxidoreductase subunit E
MRKIPMAEDSVWTKEKKAALDSVIASYRGERGLLITVLQKAQDIFGYLPKSVMEYIGESLRISASEIYGVATFYAQFSFQPRGRHTLLSCQGTACHVRGGDKILKEVLRDLKIEAGDTTEDRRFTVESVYCIGCCSLAPAVIIDDEVHAKLTPKKTKDLLNIYE